MSPEQLAALSPEVTIAVALIAVLGSVFGVWIGWRLGMSERLQQWRRDKQIDTYSELLAASADHSNCLANAAEAETTEELAAAGHQMKTASVRFANALYLARIVASSPIRPYLDHLADEAKATAVEIEKETRDQPAIDRCFSRSAALRKELADKARQDFGFR